MSQKNEIHSKLLPSFVTRGIYILILLVLAFVFELIKKYIKFDILSFLLKYWYATLALAIAGVAAPFFEAIKTKYDVEFKKRLECLKKEISSLDCETVPNSESDQEEYVLNRISPLQKGWLAGGALIHVLVKSPLLILIFFLLLTVYAPATAAHFQAYGHIIKVLDDLKVEDEYESEAVDQLQETVAPPRVNDNSPLPSESPEPSTPLETPFLTDPTRSIKLSRAELDEMYYSSGPYAIENWNDENDILEILASQLAELRNYQISNIFDEQATESMKNDADSASSREKNLKNSNDLDYVIETREHIQALCPKYVLAKLLAANYQQYALEYFAVNGEPETIEYYYWKSIYWDLESLKFSEPDNKEVQLILSLIAMRYQDIAYVAEYGSTTQLRASALSEAFNRLKIEALIQG